MMNKKSFKREYILFSICLILFLIITFSANAQIIKLYDIAPEQVAATGFTLDKSNDLKIEATVGITRSKDVLLSNCWILNANSRTVVWEFSERKAKRSRSRRMLNLEDRISLSKGNYEVYYALNPSRYNNKNIFNLIFGNSDSRKYHSSEWGISVAPVKKSDNKRFFHIQKIKKDEQAIIQITKIYNDEYFKKGFTLTAPVKLRIYAIGEGTRKGRQMFDFGWITDIKTRERVWEMNYRNSDHAGGAEKNRHFDDIITLPAGDYMVHFVTDDSHSYERWNQMPPYDPDHWGITTWALDTDPAYTIIKPYEKSDVRPAIVKLVRVRNDRFESAGFQLLDETKLHIVSAGEYSQSQRRMADYGWIVDAGTRKTVWQLDYHKSEYAGGGRKNRIFDGFVTLPAGKYLVYYRTDDSHAYRSWNEKAPWLPESWGIAISCVDEDCRKNIQTYDEQDDPDILVQMIKVYDDEKVYRRFELTVPTTVRIYAIGEGSRGKMFDYGWLETTDGEKVWEMKYEETVHAGGGKKNRLVNETIRLNPGTYLVYYKTDNCHSYQDWNTTPPDDLKHWGITVVRHQEK